MAVRLVLAAFVGGVLLMLWGLFYWFVLPIEDFIDRAPAEQRLRVSLRESLPAAGVYLLPYPRDPSAQSEAERGLPQAMIIYRTVTRDPLDATVFALGLLHSILSAGLVAVLLALAGPARLGYWRRYGFVVLAGARFLHGRDTALDLVSREPAFLSKDDRVRNRRVADCRPGDGWARERRGKGWRRPDDCRRARSRIGSTPSQGARS